MIWNLYFERGESLNPEGFDTYVDGPAPTRNHIPALSIPADVRAFAHHYGRVNGAHHVWYAVAHLADIRGYAGTGAVRSTGVRNSLHDEPIPTAAQMARLHASLAAEVEQS